MIGYSVDLKSIVYIFRENHFTAKFNGDWILIYKEEVQDRASALIREGQLKSYRGREFVKQHIPR